MKLEITIIIIITITLVIKYISNKVQTAVQLKQNRSTEKKVCHLKPKANRHGCGVSNITTQ